VVGDSVAQGEAVFEIPGTGFARAKMAPVGTFLAAQYRQRGNNDMQVRNRTASATSISSDKHTSYLNTVEYAQLLQDNCRYTLILPWINDLTTSTDTTSSAANHVFALSNLAATLVRVNPGGRILILTYYQGAPAPFALSTFASGFTPDRVNAYNAQIGAACASGALALRLVSCINIGPAFAGVPYLVGPTSRQELEASLVAPLTPEEGGLVNYFFGQNPAGLLVGDGVHLSGDETSSGGVSRAQMP
jgi:hypothetical protein